MTTRFPNLIDYGDTPSTDALAIALADAERQVDEIVWGDEYEIGWEYLAAHKTARALSVGSGGTPGGFAIASASADGVSTTFAVPPDLSPSLQPYYTTPYGAEYLEMLRRRQAGPHLV